ncbi:predicted membrane transporter [Pseudozyma hubeiensis SY62]|uniref:Predicted membrane transporter n=1 Tax=Pseudozyma hubeiensis (strain SY62) TaxID=1305764 RepID=R9P0J7_PSEHS|nr:predicted membrane transporter [Pseudozyma hubeiensis SY62]GAC94728.1 predicted membrane transporter [Pseudozyma hubeiensis SY62]
MPSSSPPSSVKTRLISRLEHMTFAWFTSSMSLGGIANLLMSRIVDSTPLYYLGSSLFLLNIVYLLLLISLQFVRYSFTGASLSYTLSHPIECCFVPTSLLACATVIIGIFNVVGQEARAGWGVLLLVFFWVYFVLSLVVSLVCYTALFRRKEQSLHHMNPAWVLPIFPLMLCGTIASVILPLQRESAGMRVMAFVGMTCQGLGFTVSVMMYSVLLLRLMVSGFPPAKARIGLFMNTGPPAFTIICLLGLSDESPHFLPETLPAYAPQVLRTIAIASSVFLWSLSAWFYLFTLASLVDVLLDKQLRNEFEFILAWWASVFPVTGFALATDALADELGSKALDVLSQVIVGWLLATFVGVAGMHIRAVVRGDIMTEGKDEDRVIDTMYHRFRDEEVPEQTPEKSPESNPPTYPSTPAMSVTRLDTKGKERSQDADVDAIDSLTEIRVGGGLRMTRMVSNE